ncbi:MAG: hypothetical protein P4L69_19110 [Desulfosporosinus sp.]|nr:hypothetical protein [Desulfosporosinus sp.]
MDNRTEKEKEFEHSQLERINAENKMVYEEMLSDNLLLQQELSYRTGGRVLPFVQKEQ